MSGLPTLSLLAHPYHSLEGLRTGTDRSLGRERQPGSALVWQMSTQTSPEIHRTVRERSGGLSLIVLLPPSSDIAAHPELVHLLQRVRPHAILPHYPDPTPHDLAQVLRRPPTDLSAEVTDYLRWRGIGIDRETAHLVRRILDLSAELRSVSAISRSMYLSRRALGRRLMTRGLPVPSHWLQVGRLLRVAIKLQNSDSTVSSVGFELGYPDGFSVSNQMERLLGHRPSEVRRRFGWEWIVEAWLRREAELGGLSASGPRVHGRAPGAPVPSALDSSRGAGRRRARSAH